MLLLDVSHTSHTLSQSGIQQVCRNLYRELSHMTEVLPIVFDPYASGWRRLTGAEQALLAYDETLICELNLTSGWPWQQKMKGRIGRCIDLKGPPIPFAECSSILVVELFNPHNQYFDALIELREQYGIALHAVFHDAIACRFPEYVSAELTTKVRAYIQKLAFFDRVAAVSEVSRMDLWHVWEEMGLHAIPALQTISLGVGFTEPCAIESRLIQGNASVLMVASIEPRKNHAVLLKVCQRLWDAGVRFQLKLIGQAIAGQSETVVAEINRLQDAGYAIEWQGACSQGELIAAYQACDFTVYPSLYEGFGLPLLESLYFGKPVITTHQGGLSEVARGGGCYMIKYHIEESLAEGIRSLIQEPDHYAKLQAEAIDRKLRSWSEYAKAIVEWVE